MRLDADLIQRTPTYLNPLKDRELDLRGHNIAAIENLGVTKDGIDSLDLTDNSITSLSNFPLLRRLQHVHISNNPIRTLSPSITTSLPNLRSLVVRNGSLPTEALASVGSVLGRCRKLEMLVLKGNPLEQAQYYKEWIVFSCKGLRSLDFERVKQQLIVIICRAQDRTRALSLFQTASGQPTPLQSTFLDAAASNSAASAPSLVRTNGTTTEGAAKTFEPGVEASVVPNTKNAGRLLTKEEKDRVRTAIERAESVDEIRRLQRMLAQGFVPTEKDLKDLQRKKAGAV
ncbi:BZ3500_MvSof-1268-A1-R1_Chr5-2g07832 [Microbotryum saponariae]|uniref:U2 small nuclear ribonucleoprotein A' n=1 Tax=Microbotryum saponariae TaxID=289078 RepID=A0A2X0L158_9BASI|nr:BZ3500_MvSof-1268-A1-R1_Chr5-2g07832 [Microbotryum saponariae]SDA05701.1 BZ3501_MvSof-1269-A2-R1_Chr5-2g07654 [Microbotryum saponariae]